MDASGLEKTPFPVMLNSILDGDMKSNMGAPEAKTSLRSATWASWLFLAGSLALVVDAILENMGGVTLSSALHLGGSLLFALGSILLVPRRPQ